MRNVDLSLEAWERLKTRVFGYEWRERQLKRQGVKERKEDIKRALEQYCEYKTLQHYTPLYKSRYAYSPQHRE